MSPPRWRSHSSTTGASPADEGLDRETLIVAGVVMLGATMSILDTTVINAALDHLAVAFNSSLTTIQWVVTGYTLSLGRRKVRVPGRAT